MAVEPTASVWISSILSKTGHIYRVNRTGESDELILLTPAQVALYLVIPGRVFRNWEIIDKQKWGYLQNQGVITGIKGVASSKFRASIKRGITSFSGPFSFTPSFQTTSFWHFFLDYFCRRLLDTLTLRRILSDLQLFFVEVYLYNFSVSAQSSRDFIIEIERRIKYRNLQ